MKQVWHSPAKSVDQSGQVLEEMGLEEDRLSARGESTHIGKYGSSCDGGRAWAFSGLSSKVYYRLGWYRAWREQAGGGDRGRRRAKLAPGLLAKAPVMLLLTLDFTFHMEDEQGPGCGRGNP